MGAGGGLGPELEALVRRQHGLFTTQQAKQRGVGKMALSRAARAGGIVRVLRGVYRLSSAVPTYRQRLLAGCLFFGPDAVVSHAAAARLYKLDGFDADVVEFSVNRRLRCPRKLDRVHWTEVVEADRRVVDGIPVTSVARTLVDVAEGRTVAELSIPLDCAWRRNLIRLDYVQFRLKARARKGRSGVGTLRRAIADCYRRGQPLGSILEVRSWYLLRKEKLPPPICGLRFEPLDGQPGAIDLAYPEHSLAIECDGYEHHALTREQFQATERRASMLAALGWRVQHITKAMLDREPDGVAERVRHAIATPRVEWDLPPGFKDPR